MLKSQFHFFTLESLLFYMAKGEFMSVLFTSTFFGISLLYANLHAKVLNECVSDTHRQRGCIEKMYWLTEIGESAIVRFQVPYHNGKREGLYNTLMRVEILILRYYTKMIKNGLEIIT